MKRKDWFGTGVAFLIAGAAVFAADPVKKEDPIEIAEEITSVTTYTMASPRAFLMGVPIEGADDLAMIGAAENFTRANGTLEIPVNTRVFFSLSQETEGVWQQGTYGTIETAMTVQWFQAAAEDECEACVSAGLRDDSDQTGKGDDAASCPWTTIGTDGARDTRTGPSLGYTKIAVPVEFTQVGTYCVRAIVSTSVRSSYLRSPEPENPTTKQEAPAQSSEGLLASDTDVVLVTVRVLAATAKPQGALTSDPQVLYTAPMPNTSQTKAKADEDTRKDSGALSLSGPGVFFGSREPAYAIAL
ncbi:MAG: hypothetical protein GX448_19160 [Planctomycetes bacterium]|nr:hypothetical protein [Planctomycetota bacterium]